jgi:hypothetical protein
MNWTPAAYRLWHRYPQPREAHAERPWWRTLDAAGVTWERVDGRRLTPMRPTADPTDYRRVVWFVGTSDDGREVEGTLAEALAAVDAAEPLDAPPPLVGQVWVWPEHDAGGTEHLVSSVQCWPEGEVWGVQMGGRWQVFGRGADMGEAGPHDVAAGGRGARVGSGRAVGADGGGAGQAGRAARSAAGGGDQDGRVGAATSAATSARRALADRAGARGTASRRAARRPRSRPRTPAA